MKMNKKRYLAKAIALFKAFKSSNLTTADFGKADGMAGNLGRQADDFRLLIRMAKDTFAGRYKMNKWNMSVIVGTIVYVISPLDAVPDMIPVLGWLDDASIVAYALSKLKDEIGRYKMQQIAHR